MAAEATYKLLVLFEDEVRIAAKALAAFKVALADDSDDQDALGEAARSALQACMTALDGAEDDAAVVMLGRKPSPATPQEKP